MRKSTLKKAAIAGLLTLFADAAEQYMAPWGKHPREINRQHDISMNVYEELTARGPEPQSALLSLENDPRLGVRVMVGVYALKFAPKDGVRILETVAATPESYERATAANLLDSWREGTLPLV